MSVVTISAIKADIGARQRVSSTAASAGASIAYGLVSIAFLWQLFASLLDVPRWMLDLSPFRHIGLVPAQSFQAGSAAVMIAIGLVARWRRPGRSSGAT